MNALPVLEAVAFPDTARELKHEVPVDEIGLLLEAVAKSLERDDGEIRELFANYVARGVDGQLAIGGRGLVEADGFGHWWRRIHCL